MVIEANELCCFLVTLLQQINLQHCLKDNKRIHENATRELGSGKVQQGIQRESGACGSPYV